MTEFHVRIKEDLRIKETLKQKHPGFIVIFHHDTFYECYGEDAKEVAEITGISLCKRKGIMHDLDMAGVPAYHLSEVFGKLIAAGKRVVFKEDF